MCSCVHLPCSHTLRIPQPGPCFISEVHTLADDIDVLLEGLMDKICQATGQTREELPRELEMVELEEEMQPETASDETIDGADTTTTLTTTTTTVDEDVSDFFRVAQADPILTREDLLRAPIHPPISRPTPSTTTTTVVDDDASHFHSSTQNDPVPTPQEILGPVHPAIDRPRRGRFPRHLLRRRLARAQQLQQRREQDDEEEGEEGGQAGWVIRVRLPGQEQVRRVRRP